jgi:hypothetical protein
MDLTQDRDKIFENVSEKTMRMINGFERQTKL